MKLWATVLMLPLVALGQGSKPASLSEGQLREPYSAGTHSLGLFSNDPRLFTFTLTTSWIPGEGHKGYFRYRVKIKASEPTKIQRLLVADHPDSWWSVAETTERIARCRLTLEVYDAGGFILRRTSLTPNRIVDDSSVLTGLEANDMEQMDVVDYKSFMQTESPTGWNIGFFCN